MSGKRIQKKRQPAVPSARGEGIKRVNGIGELMEKLSFEGEEEEEPLFLLKEEKEPEGFSADYRAFHGKSAPTEKEEISTFETVLPRDPFEEPGEKDGGFFKEELACAEEKAGFVSEKEPSSPEEGEAQSGPQISFTPRGERKKKRRRYGIFVGSLVLLLALVGVVSLVSVITGQLKSWLSPGEPDLHSYESFLAPVVMQDPEPFESAEKADPDLIVTAGLWYVLMNRPAAAYASYDEQGRAVLPLGEVVNGCCTLFGPNCPVFPRTPKGKSFFEYDNGENRFLIQNYSTDSSFAPYVSEGYRSGDSLFLKVGYISAADGYRIGLSEEPAPVKYMEYELKTDPDSGREYIAAIRKAKER